MLKSCEQEQICTIHRLVTFEHKQIGGEGVTPIETKQPSAGKTKGKTVAKDFYQIPTRDKSGEIKVLTLLKENVSTVQRLLTQHLKILCLTKNLSYKMHPSTIRQS